jgi:hypothetical protein
MPFGIQKVNVLLHGLFFMRQSANNLEVLAPNIPGHHFIGGVRGTRQELTGTQDLTALGLVGKNGAPSLDDVDGGIMQFPLSAVSAFKPTNGPQFLGSILLPWPIKFSSLRADKIATAFRAIPNSSIGKAIVQNALGKGRDSLGVVTLLQYTIPPAGIRSDASQLNIHFYLQPRNPHNIRDVNQDLDAAANCFVNSAGFDLQMTDDGNDPPPAQATGNLVFGTTVEDERSVDEEFLQSPDIALICKNDPVPSLPPPQTGPQPNVSPANCPTFFVG